MSEEKKYNIPRDVFMHILAIVALYASAFSFGSLLFNYVDKLLPDPLAPLYFSEAVRSPLATLIVFFPVFFFLTRFLNREYAKTHGEKEPWIRRWSAYLTLFVSALVIIADLITLLRTYLDGELTLRFLLKVIVVLFIALVVFRYYLWNLHMKPARYIPFLVGVATAAVIATVIGGLFLVGSPTGERAKRFDERRINDLQTLQNEIIGYWQRTNKLPENLDALRNDITNFVPPHDPETNAVYEYRGVAQLQFELCATFVTSNQASASSNSRLAPQKPVSAEPYYAGLLNWQHAQERTCFTRTIDPTFYQNIPSLPQKR